MEETRDRASRRMNYQTFGKMHKSSAVGGARKLSFREDDYQDDQSLGSKM